MIFDQAISRGNVAVTFACIRSQGNYVMNRRVVLTNGCALRVLRNERGWTQRELARRSGYTERLVRKAELGGSLDLQTVVDIADALSQELGKVALEDLEVSRDIVSLVQCFMNGFFHQGRDMIEDIETYLSPGFSLIIAGAPRSSVLSGEWKFPTGLQQFVDRFYGLFQRSSNECIDVAYTTGDRIVSARYRESLMVDGFQINPFWVNLHFRFSGGLIESIDVDFDAWSLIECAIRNRTIRSSLACRL
jgi:transcriptional regulator with XRE-family HTH domain